MSTFKFDNFVLPAYSSVNSVQPEISIFSMSVRLTFSTYMHDGILTNVSIFVSETCNSISLDDLSNYNLRNLEYVANKYLRQFGMESSDSI